MQKWFHEEENLKESDIVYFKLTDSPSAANWRVEKLNTPCPLETARSGLLV